ncbi:MAG: hypothetical protein ACREEM_15065 [Blastocatellia bacterium]
MSAKSCTCCPSITRAISPEVVLTASPAVEVTTTVSDTSPGSSGKSTVNRPSATSVRPACTPFLNPARSQVMR